MPAPPVSSSRLDRTQAHLSMRSPTPSDPTALRCAVPRTRSQSRLQRLRFRSTPIASCSLHEVRDTGHTSGQARHRQTTVLARRATQDATTALLELKRETPTEGDL